MTSYHHIIISCRMNTKMETNQLHVKSCAHVGSESSDGDLRFQSQPVSQAAVFETLFTNLSLMGSFPHDQIKITHAQNSNNTWSFQRLEISGSFGVCLVLDANARKSGNSEKQPLKPAKRPQKPSKRLQKHARNRNKK